ADVQLLHHDPGDAVDLRVAAECARVPALAARDGCDHLTGRGPENVHTGLWGAHDRGDDERRNLLSASPHPGQDLGIVLRVDDPSRTAEEVVDRRPALSEDAE